MAHKVAGSFDLDVLGSLARLADGALANSTITRLVQNEHQIQTQVHSKLASAQPDFPEKLQSPERETGKGREGPIDLGDQILTAGQDLTKTASTLGGAPQDPAYTSPGAREAHGANVDGHLDGGDDAEIVTWRKYIAKVACDLVAARRADTFEPTSKAALPHETASTPQNRNEKQALLRNPTLPANYPITGQPQANPVQAATNAAVVGPGTSPSTNPIGSFGPLAANPGEVTGNSALGVQHNVLKLGQWAAFGSLLDALGMEEQPDGSLRALTLSEVRAKQAVTINKTALDARAIDSGVSHGARLGLMAGAGYGGYRGWTGYGSPESQKRTTAKKLLHAVMGAGGGALLGASSGGMLGGFGALGMQELQAANAPPQLPVPPAPPELIMPKAGGFFGKKKPRSKPVKPLGRFITREEIMAYKPETKKTAAALCAAGYGLHRYLNKPKAKKEKAKAGIPKTAAADFGDRLARLCARGGSAPLGEANPFRHGDCTDAPRTFRYSLRLKEAGSPFHERPLFQASMLRHPEPGPTIPGSAEEMQRTLANQHDANARFTQESRTMRNPEGDPAATFYLQRQGRLSDEGGPLTGDNRMPGLLSGSGFAPDAIPNTAGPGQVIRTPTRAALPTKPAPQPIGGGRVISGPNITSAPTPSVPAAPAAGGMPKVAGTLDTVLNHPVTPFVAQPVIGAGLSLGLNEVMRRLSEAYVGKPAKEDEVRRGRFMAAGVGTGMGLSRAARPHIESWAKGAALTLPAAMHSQAKPGFGKPKKPVTGAVAAAPASTGTSLAPKLANWVEQLMQTGLGQVPGVQAMLGGSSGQAPASGGSSVIASPSMPPPVPPAQNPGQVNLPTPAVPQQTPSSPGMTSVANQPIDISKPGMMGAGPAAKSLPQSFASEMGSQMKAPQVPMKPNVIPPAGGAGAGLVQAN